MPTIIERHIINEAAESVNRIKEDFPKRIKVMKVSLDTLTDYKNDPLFSEWATELQGYIDQAKVALQTLHDQF
ncbi:MAG: hypothetical protein WBG58_09125 [Ignavibacteriaceae bacterium]